MPSLYRVPLFYVDNSLRIHRSAYEWIIREFWRIQTRKNRFYLISFSSKRLRKNGKLWYSRERSTNIARGKLGRKQISLIRDPVIAKRLPKRNQLAISQNFSRIKGFNDYEYFYFSYAYDTMRKRRV